MLNNNLCNLCNYKSWRLLGYNSYHKDVKISGNPIILKNYKYSIRVCPSCGFLWKHPQLPYNEYLENYKKSYLDDWISDETAIKDRRLKEKQLIIEKCLKNAGGHRVLDIGCGHGDFLSCWGDDWEKYGVEINVSACKACREAGIAIIGESIEDVANVAVSFDIISMMDVIEHLPSPYVQLKAAISKLKKGGAIVIETGNVESLISKIMQVDWHYYSAIEHISFFSEQSLRFLFERLGIETRLIYKWPHMVRSRWHKFKGWQSALQFKWPFLRPRHLLKTIISQKRWPQKEGSSPWLTGLNDHIFIIGIKQ